MKIQKLSEFRISHQSFVKLPIFSTKSTILEPNFDKQKVSRQKTILKVDVIHQALETNMNLPKKFIQ